MNKAVHINLETEIVKQNLLAETNLDLLTLVICLRHYISKLGVITVEMCYGQLQ